MRVSCAISFLLGVSLGGHASAHGTENHDYDAASKAVTIEGAVARATPPSARVGVAFMTVTSVHEDDILIGGETSIAEDVQLHTHTMDANGVMRMRQVEGGIALPAGEATMLMPGGLHIMLIGLKTPLVEGTSFDLMLDFEAAVDRTVSVPVGGIAARPEGAMQGDRMNHGSMDHNGANHGSMDHEDMDHGGKPETKHTH